MREVSVGENLDQYKLIEVIARSGMASIFKAIDQIDGKTVAIKVPYMQFESDVVFYGRFQREEEVGRRLNHLNIIKVLTPKRKSRMYIAMEYVEGLSLRAMMREPGGMPTEKALDIARQQEALSWELRAATSLARLLRNQRRPADAIVCLRPIYDRFTEGFGTADLVAAKQLLNELSHGRQQRPAPDS